MKQPFTLLAQAILMTLLIKKRKKDLEIRVTAQIYQLTMARLPKNAPSQTIYEMQLWGLDLRGFMIGTLSLPVKVGQDPWETLAAGHQT